MVIRHHLSRKQSIRVCTAILIIVITLEVLREFHIISALEGVSTFTAITSWARDVRGIWIEHLFLEE